MRVPALRRLRGATASFFAMWTALLCIEPNATADAPPGSGEPGDEVVLRREAPFDRWCVAPLCSGPSQQQARLKVPAIIEPVSQQGLLESRLRGALDDALDAAARAAVGPVYNEAVADLAEAIAAVAAGDRDRVARVGGMGAAVLRAGLTYELDRVIPGDPQCPAPRRLDAIYEGLGISVALAPLSFPERRHRVLRVCEPTALRAARTIDGAVLRALLSDAVRRDASAAVQTIESMEDACATLPGDLQQTVRTLRAYEGTQHGTVSDALRMIHEAGANAGADAGSAAPTTLALAHDDPAPPTAAEQACSQAQTAARSISPAPLEALAQAGLADADLDALVVAFGPAAEDSATIVRFAAGAADEKDMSALVDSLLRGAGVDTPILRDAITALPKAIVVENGAPTVDPNVIVAFLTSRYEVDDDGKPGLRTLLGLQPTPWVFELNGGVPNVDFSQQKVVADATFGYATKNLGIVGRGWIDTYDLDDSQTHNDYTHGGGSLEGWWLSGSGTEKLRVEVRLSGEFDYYDTTTYPLQDALNQFYDFDSRMVRGSALLGLRYGSPVDRVSVQLLVGGGGQFEDPDTTRFTGGQTLSLMSDQNLTAQANGRLLVRVHIVPQILGARMRAESSFFSITREQLSVAGSGGALSTSSTVEQEQQIEVHTRAFLDAEVASFGGFVPALFAGLDYIGIQGSATTLSSAIPMLGAGITRQSW